MEKSNCPQEGKTTSGPERVPCIESDSADVHRMGGGNRNCWGARGTLPSPLALLCSVKTTGDGHVAAVFFKLSLP